MEQLTTSLAPPRANPKPTATNSSQQVAGSVAKRLSNELMTLMMSSSPGISAFPKSDGNLFEWAGTIEGPAETRPTLQIYAGLSFRISISFPANYPLRCPRNQVRHALFPPERRHYLWRDLSRHSTGTEAAPLFWHVLTHDPGIKDKWSAVYSVQTILLSLQSLLGEPNNASPLNTDAAAVWDTPDAFKTQLMRHYRPLKDTA
ncbi:Ubiquitin-conjugating enzyme E2 [Mycena venus]|uniref:Ubiquitin-conjugating enzyme E2 n=1 Tax=Mycena venus TaxID=2733690 RepID=A0A8H6XDS2_9AGAR|nr:Ubiquitin-conjugating enzyme E2 [Mycena venus]